MSSSTRWFRTAARPLACAAAMAVITVALSHAALARSPVNSPEYDAEAVAISKMQTYWGGYSVRAAQVQMRSNRLSVSIPTSNRIGNQVNFESYVRRCGSFRSKSRAASR